MEKTPRTWDETLPRDWPEVQALFLWPSMPSRKRKFKANQEMSSGHKEPCLRGALEWHVIHCAIVRDLVFFFNELCCINLFKRNRTSFQNYPKLIQRLTGPRHHFSFGCSPSFERWSTAAEDQVARYLQSPSLKYNSKS